MFRDFLCTQLYISSQVIAVIPTFWLENHKKADGYSMEQGGSSNVSDILNTTIIQMLYVL